MFAKFSAISANKPLAQRSDATSTSHANERTEEADTSLTLVSCTAKGARSPAYVATSDRVAHRADNDDFASRTPTDGH